MLPHPSGCLVRTFSSRAGSSSPRRCSVGSVVLAAGPSGPGYCSLCPHLKCHLRTRQAHVRGHCTHPSWNLRQEPDLGRWCPDWSPFSRGHHGSGFPRSACASFPEPPVVMQLVGDRYCHPGGFACSYSWRSSLTLPWGQMNVQPQSDVSIGEKIL